MATRLVRMRRAWRAVLVVALAAVTVSASAASGERYALRSAQLEALPITQQKSRYRLHAGLEPTPAPATTSGGAALRLTAALVPKAGAAQCALPGTVFSDGFDGS